MRTSTISSSAWSESSREIGEETGELGENGISITVGFKGVTHTQGFVYNTANQITSSGYAYDPAGNLKQDSNFKYTYDAWNRLTEVHNAYDDSLVAAYAYDGQGRRIAKTVGDTTTHYYYDTSWRVVEEQQSVGSGDAAVTAQYLWRPGSDTPILKWTDFVDGEATRTLYYTTDAFGKVTALIDGDTGAVVERYVYDPYGAVTFLQGNQEGQTEWAPTVVEGQAPGTASAVGNEILYAGYRYDPETSLYQLRNRQYDPSTGRFLQRDPSGYNGTMNSYGYAGGNPVTAYDPLGLESVNPLNEKPLFISGAGSPPPTQLNLYGNNSYMDFDGGDSVTTSGIMLIIWSNNSEIQQAKKKIETTAAGRALIARLEELVRKAGHQIRIKESLPGSQSQCDSPATHPTIIRGIPDPEYIQGAIVIGINLDDNKPWNHENDPRNAPFGVLGDGPEDVSIGIPIDEVVFHEMVHAMQQLRNLDPDNLNAYDKEGNADDPTLPLNIAMGTMEEQEFRNRWVSRQEMDAVNMTNQYIIEKSRMEGVAPQIHTRYRATKEQNDFVGRTLRSLYFEYPPGRC